MAEIKTIVDFGADPTGKKDCSDAIVKMAKETSAVVIPSGYTFTLGKTADISGLRAGIWAFSKQHFGKGSKKGELVAAKGFTGPMIKGVYSSSNVVYVGNGESTAFECDSYLNKLHGNVFTRHKVGVKIDGGVDMDFEHNDFTWCETGIHSTGKVATASLFFKNFFQYVDDCIIYDGELHNGQFMFNTFERVKGYPIRAKYFGMPVFIGNWFENTNGRDGESLPVTTSMNQQIDGATAFGNRCIYGFRDVFGDSEHNGKVGGVNLGKNDIVIRNRTGKALRITENGVFQELDDWAGRDDFVLSSGYAKGARKACKFVMRPSYKMPIYFENYWNDQDNRQPFEKGLYFLNGFDKNKKDLNTKWQYGTQFGAQITTELELSDQTRVDVVGGTGVDAKWHSDSKMRRGLDMFKTCKESGKGEITVDTEKRLYFYNPALKVTVKDRGISFDGFEYINSKNSDYQSCTGFKLYFVDDKGNAATPSEFHIEIKSFKD